ncbi:MAG TPA: hypothetical protein VGL93_17230 [Streptosporangiaceae bacterium]|jgi:hypothetical protein
MKPVRSLDTAHVLAVCAYAARTSTDGPDTAQIEITTGTDAIRIRFTDQAQQAAALQAVQAAGYDANAEATMIIVRGWSHTMLADRVVRLDKAAQWLADQLAFTARRATDLYRRATGDGIRTDGDRADTGRADQAARNLARRAIVTDLRERVQHRTGPLLSHHPDVRPDDASTRSLLHRSWGLEDEADGLLSRHRALATQAIAEYRVARARTEQAVHVANQDVPTGPSAETAESGDRPAADVVPLTTRTTQPGDPAAPHPGRGA